MKLSYLPPSALVAAIFVGYLAAGDFRSRSEVERVDSIERPRAKGAVGTKDDPMGRFDFELLRTADPATGVIPADIRRRELAYARTLPVHTAKTSALTWARRGPFNVGGRTRGFGIDVRDKDILLAGGVTGSIWRSTDGGATWTDAFADSDLHSVTSIAQDKRAGAEDTWYAGTGEVLSASGGASGAPYRGNGVYKSTDNGVTWTALSSTSTTITNAYVTMWQYVWEVATDPSAGTSEVYAAHSGGIDRSIDGGASFASVLFGGAISSGCRTDVATSSTGTVYAALSSSCAVGGGDTGIYSSSTGASGDWSDLSYPHGPGFRRTEISISPANEDWVWFLTQLNGGAHKLYLHNPSLATCPGIGGAPASGWCDYSAFLPARATAAGTGVFDTQSSYDMTVKAHPVDSTIVLVGGTSLYRIDIMGTPGTNGSGDTWIGGYTATGASAAGYVGDEPGSDEHHADQHSGSFLPPPYGVGAGENDPDVFISGSDGGLHRTPDVMAAGDGSVDWYSLNSGYHTTQFYTVCMNADDGDAWIGGGLQDNGTWGTKSAVSTASWLEEFSGDGSHCAIANNSISGTSRYASAQNGVIYRFTYNAAGSYTGFTRVDPTGGAGYLFINPFVLDPSDETVMYLAAGDSLWRNSDLEGIAMFSNATTSTNWTELDVPGLASRVSAVAVSTTGSILYYGTESGDLFRIDGADTYTPGSAVTSISSGLPSAYVSSIAVDPGDADRVMITFSNYNTAGVWFSSDAGGSWTNVEGNLLGTINGFGDDGPSFRSAALLPEAAATSYFVGTSTGLYSTDALSGASTVWTQEGASEIDRTIVDMVRARASDGLVIAGTHGHGLFSADASLPVELAEVRAIVEADDILVSWTTQSELNNSGFEVEYRPALDDSYETAGFVAGAGTKVEPTKYSFRISDVLPGPYLIRLKQIDVSGAVSYSPSVEASVMVDEPFVLTDAYPNPASDRAELALVAGESGEASVSLFDATGRLVRVLHDGAVAANTPTRFEIDVARLAAGVYFVRLDSDRHSISKQLVVVR